MKKGFTLIELLAVIVILAIIALIATPIILGVVENARKSAAGSSALGYIDAVEKEIALGGFNETVYPKGEVDIIVTEPYNTIDVNGSMPSKGILNITDNYVIETSVLCVNGYRVEVEGHKVKRIVKNGCDDIKTTYKEELLKGTWPKLSGDLIPVIIAPDGGVKAADVYDEWYKYEDKRWANAVLLDDDIIPDISGNGNHGYLQNGPIRNDASVTTDGVDDYVYAGLMDHEFQNELSIVLRVKLNSKVNHDLFDNVELAGMSLFVRDDYKFAFQIYSNSKNAYYGIHANEVYELNKWYTIVGTFKDNKLHLYINGKEAATPVEFTGATDIKNSMIAFLIGANPYSRDYCNSTNHTCGNMTNLPLEFTDALIFDRALSENEIKYDYAGKITNLSNDEKLLLRYDLDDDIKPDTPLPEEVIESYFVWIPKFKYQLWDLGEYDDYIKDESVYNSAPSVVHEIKIEFNATNTTNINGKECIATNKSNDVGTCKVGDWMTHPAFTNFGVNGFWIGKFESSGVTESVKIKPNVNSLNNISFKTMFDTAYNYKRDLDSHMLKNTEWGAVAYLSHSKYGIGKEVNINNNSKYITGCGAIAGSAESDECNNYTTELGKGASTTGNITGVYDMSGGSGEYVASFLSGVDSGEGFTEEEIKKYGSKYFDIYNFLATHDTESSFKVRILGDATGEMGPFYGYSGLMSSWYFDHAMNFRSDYPCQTRGGYYGGVERNGIFRFDNATGIADEMDSFRIALSPM